MVIHLCIVLWLLPSKTEMSCEENTRPAKPKIFTIWTFTKKNVLAPDVRAPVGPISHQNDIRKKMSCSQPQHGRGGGGQAETLPHERLPPIFI